MDEDGSTSAVIDDAAVDNGLVDDAVADKDAFAFSPCAETRTAMATTTTE